MDIWRRSILLPAVALLVGSAGCDSPTAPQLLQRLDNATQELTAPGAAASAFRQYLLYATRAMPPDRIDSVLTVSIDGRTARYSAVVYERVVVRADPGDGYPCPLTFRTLAAYDGGAYALLLTGSDFSQPMRTEQNGWCLEGFIQQPAPSPHVELVDEWRQAYSAISGSARFDDAGVIGPCEFLYDRTDPPLFAVSHIDCEIREYVVETTARLARSLVPRPVPPARPARQVSFRSQRVVGIRLTVYCRQISARDHRMENPVGGCEHTTRWKNVVDGVTHFPIDSVP